MGGQLYSDTSPLVFPLFKAKLDEVGLTCARKRISKPVHLNGWPSQENVKNANVSNKYNVLLSIL
jgi:hypothetical protein